jgi:NAD(P)-dependent dehydrogenase (short-subunit alcohol dehydrogenase family)
MRDIRFDSAHWALILGGSSGFGLATAQKLARGGMSVCIVHRDRRGSMAAIDAEFAKIKETMGPGPGRTESTKLLTFNLDGLSVEGRKTVLDGLTEQMGSTGRVRLLMHSIAYGNLKLLAPLPPAMREAGGAGYDSDMLLEDEDFARTVYSMGTSLATWAMDVFSRKLFAGDARVLGMTSEGNEVAWRGYAAVSAAKTALEAVSRSLAVELGPFGVRSNIVQAGVTDTPALRLIPGSGEMKASAAKRNPLGRLTTTADVADFIALLCTDEARWVNGAILRVDGGEHIAG